MIGLVGGGGICLAYVGCWILIAGALVYVKFL